MSRTQYESELDVLPVTYTAARTADVACLKLAIAGASQSSLIAVGSGGSFTVASVMCNLHEAYTGHVSRPSTPLEIICNPTLAATSPVFLVSAEGKNPDIVEALKRARGHSSRELHILTNRTTSPLVDCAARLPDITVHTFELAQKDGYLATNSLLLDAVVVARAYAELDHQPDQIPRTIADLHIARNSLSQWLESAVGFVHEAVARRGIIVLYSPLLRAIAADLESKLSEGALLNCQLADFRSFAHGRHLWLAQRPTESAILALTEPVLEEVWREMRSRIPVEVPAFAMPLDGAKPGDLLTGLIAAMQLVSKVAAASGRDVGRPRVPEFGRALYYTSLSGLPPATELQGRRGERSKRDVLGAKWPSIGARGVLIRALRAFEGDLSRQIFRGVVFDYDGTLCRSQPEDTGPPEQVASLLTNLINEGIHIGIASGRGGSLQENLRTCLPEPIWPKVQLGLYNCGWIGHLGKAITRGERTVEFLSHVTRIVTRLRDSGVPIENIRATHPYQVSVRFRTGVHAEDMWLVIADALRQAGLDISAVVRSRHSVDILANGVSKSHLIANMLQTLKIDPYEILVIGDQGAWPGNDSSLLEHRFSLSVKFPSRRLDRGWNLAPDHSTGVDATLWYYQHFHVTGPGSFAVALPSSVSSL